MENRFNRLYATLAAILLVGVTLVAPPPAFATGAQATVGMPFAGKWAWSTAATVPYNNNVADSHPAAHEIYGADWATDLYAQDADVVAVVASTDGAVSLSIFSVTDTSCGAGKRVKVKVRVGTTTVGYVSYEHLDTALTAASPWPANNVLGKTKFWRGANNTTLSCYQVTSASGSHAHVSFTNETGNACYIDKGQPGASTLSQGDAIGKLGDTGATGDRQACSSAGSAPQNGTDTFGSYNPANAMFYITNAMQPTAAEATFAYGNGGWTPLIGDWDGNGTDTFGSYNSATATFYISNALAPSAAEATFVYGNAGWVPLVGDWDGNGTDTFGTYNPANAMFYISNALQPSGAEAVFSFGNGGWTPLVGDWDGNGTDTFGTYNPATATFYISNALAPSVAEATFMFGNGGWLPLVGDWDGNGTDTFGTYNPATATFHITNALQPTAAEATFSFGNGGWLPLIGDWNGS